MSDNERKVPVSNWDGKACGLYPPAEIETPVTQEVVAAVFHMRRAKEQLEQGHNGAWFEANALDLLKLMRECFEIINAKRSDSLP